MLPAVFFKVGPNYVKDAIFRMFPKHTNLSDISTAPAVFCNKVEPNYGQPWQMCPQRTTTGSAFVIDPQRRRILTNNHVIESATTILIRRPGVPRKWQVRQPNCGNIISMHSDHSHMLSVVLSICLDLVWYNCVSATCSSKR